METLFWFVVALGAVTVAGYPVAIIAIAAVLPARREPPAPPLRATLLIAAHNEEACIGAKLDNALAKDVAPHRLSIVVVADGCTDRTAEIVTAYQDPRVALFDAGEHLGKIAAMQRALEHVDSDVVIFSDANSLFAPGALAALLGGFTTPQVGGVCGALAIARRGSGWLGKAENLYWWYDNALKQAESRLGGAVSAQGSLYAVRRDLLGTVPLSVADDFFISTQVVAAGKRLRFEPKAVTVEPVSNNTRGEFGRRVRSTERGWRGLLTRRALLNPFRTGAYAVQLLFHKVLRRMVPLMLALALVLSALLAPQHWIYAMALAGQAVFYGIALGALAWPPLRRLPGATVAFFFVETQVAMALGLSRVALGLHSRRWTPVRDAS
jgi:cellulose synthase/poly-beta-1,6-N-acetylglucosamine synthase-like glycosyltransferase